MKMTADCHCEAKPKQSLEIATAFGLAMTKDGIATGTTSPRNDKAGNVIARLRQQPKQSYIDVIRLPRGLRPLAMT